MSRELSTEKAREFAVWIVRQLRDAGYEALWAGGCVRDSLLGMVPSDYDVATSAKPGEVRRCFGHSRTLTMGAAFGVVTVLGTAEQGQIEIATFRSEEGYSDGRHPDHVHFSNDREDALRRDFTMNGLFYDPLAQKVIDYVGGREDLQAGIVRAIGDPYERIGEDRLRMLRAVRFATTYDFQLDDATAAAIRHEARHVTMVSVERIATEMRKMLVHPRRAAAVALLRDLQLLEVILPEAAILVPADTDSVLASSAANWDNTLAILGRLDEPTFRVALAGLLWGIQQRTAGGDDVVGEIGARWKLSNHEQNGVEWMLGNLPFIRHATEIPWPRLQRLLVSPMIDELLTLAAAVALQIDGTDDQIEFCRRRRSLPKDQWNPAPLITGDDLRTAGFRAGPIYKQILESVRDAQLEDRVTTRAAALELAHALHRDATGNE